MPNQNNAHENYEASLRAYYDTIPLALDMFFQLLRKSAKKTDGSSLDNSAFFKEWGTCLPSIAVDSLTPISELESAVIDALSINKGKDISDAITSNLTSIFEDEKSSSIIAIDASQKVNAYVKKYDIKTNSVDNYKVRYFMGLAITDYLNQHRTDFPISPRLLRGISQLMLLFVMQATLKVDNEYGVTSDMFKKFAISLLENEGEGINDLFGKYGLYLILKTVSKCHANSIDRSLY